LSNALIAYISAPNALIIRAQPRFARKLPIVDG